MRFTGTCEELAPVDASGMAAWIAAIPFSEWPQDSDRPAMVADPAWHGFADVARPVVASLMPLFAGCEAEAYQHYVSVVMPGHSIPPHRDEQGHDWLCRVHVPLITNARSEFLVGDQAHHMTPGMAYRVNTLAVHSVINQGSTPRIHFMFDVRQPESNTPRMYRMHVRQREK
jgi:hypothetical protein